jgi:hypothetical protein
MSCSTLGTTYTSVSGRTIISGGAANTMGGGRGILTCISTPAIVGIGTTITNAKSIVPKSNFFIFLPPLLGLDSFFSCLLLSYYRVENIFPPR